MCEQWRAIRRGKTAPSSLEEALAEMAGSGKKIAIILDSLDQMQQVRESRTKLHWLPGEDVIPANVRIIVSCLPDDPVHNPGGGTYRYGCATRLEKLGVPIEHIGGVVGADAAVVVNGMLAAARRTLTPEQRAEMESALGSEPTVLLCRLAADRALRWTSWMTPAAGEFPRDVRRCPSTS